MSASIKQSVRHFHMLGAIAPFAAASGGANTFLLLTKAMAKFIKVCLCLLTSMVPIELVKLDAHFTVMKGLARGRLLDRRVITSAEGGPCLYSSLVMLADLPPAAVPARAAVLVPCLQLGAATMAGSAPGAQSSPHTSTCLPSPLPLLRLCRLLQEFVSGFK